MFFTSIVVTCANILTLQYSRVGHPFSFSVMQTLSYRLIIPKNYQTPSFGTMLEPRLFVAQSLSMSELLRYLSRIAASKQTSSLSLKLYILTCTEHRFRDLKYGSGLFPFWLVELRPHSLTAKLLILSIRSLIEFARLLPVELFQCSTPKRNTWR